MAKNKNKGKAKKANQPKGVPSNSKLPLPDPPPPPKKRPSSTKSREPLKQISAAQVNMTGRRQRTKKPAEHRPTAAVMDRYMSEDSVERLERDGFDERVTDLSPQQVFEQWSKTADTQSHKLPDSQSGPAGHTTRTITSAPLTLTSEFCIMNRQRIDYLLPTPVPEGLESHDNVQPDDANGDKDSAIGLDVASHAGSQSTASDKSSKAIAQGSSDNATSQSDSGSTSSNKDQSPGDLADKKKTTLADVLAIAEVGSAVLEEVFATGFHNVEKLAMTSLQYLGLVRRVLVTMDCTGGKLASSAARSTMLLAVAPEITIQDFRCARDRDPLGLHDFNFIKAWCADALKEEAQVIRDIGALAFGKRLAERVPAPVVKVIKMLKMQWDDNMFAKRPIVCGQDEDIYQPTVQREARNLRDLLTHLHQRRATMTHVHFHKVALLDRRVLVSVLRACPKITTVSIDACPLMHLGDLLSILDEIHAINGERKDQGEAKITGLNFGPMFERGMPEACEGFSATYGLTWDPIRFDVSQVGLYEIILKAFFKAHGMGLSTLFDKDGALMHFLLKLPADPLGIPIFLDACYRLKDRLAVTDDPEDLQLRKATYDLLRIARVGFSWPGNKMSEVDFFNNKMMKVKKYCKCCGYSLLEAFFYPLNHVSEDRTCYGCMLQDELDQQSHRLRKKRMQCLDILFPDHQPQAIDNEAPINNPVLKLVSMTPVDPSLPTLQFNPQTAEIEALIDPTKRRHDTRASLVGVWPNPTLFGTDESSEKVWKSFFNRCHQVDLFRTAVEMVFAAVTEGKLPPSQWNEVRQSTGHGLPDHRLEIQRRAHPDASICNTHAEAKQNHLEMVSRGLMPGTLARLTSEDEQADLEKAQEAGFW